MPDRFFAAEPIVDQRVTLAGAEAHHLLHVLRVEVGRRVTLFDGSGAEYTATVANRSRAEVTLEILDRQAIDRERACPLILAVSLPKGDRQKWLVEKLTELGATALVPLLSERGVAQPTAAAIDRLGRSVVEASKQCGRNRLMAITRPRAWHELAAASDEQILAAVAGEHPPVPVADAALQRIVAHPAGPALAGAAAGVNGPALIAVGPEGGWSEAEIAAAVAAGWEALSLGPRVLRVETAAVAMAAAFTLP